MTALKIIAVILGLSFTLFGYFIFFRKRYSLISGFDEEYRAGSRTEAYARRAGMVEFVLGIAILLAGALLILLD